MSFGRKLAACPLLAKAHGVDMESDQITVAVHQKIMCDDAVDCGDCILFDSFIGEKVQGTSGKFAWACFQCVKDLEGEFLGYYDSGYCSLCGTKRIILQAVII
jgi:hypothetical protein